MGILFRLTASAALIAVPTAAVAEDKWAVQPIQVGMETVRYFKDTPTLDLELNDGVVQVTPLPMDHGRLRFGIAVYNDGLAPANFGVENVMPIYGDAPVQVLTRRDLERKAKNRAMWTSIGLGLLGVVGSAAAASQRDYYSSTFVTPRGTYSSIFSAPSVSGQFQASAIAASTGVGIGLVQMQLDRTIAALGDDVVQRTTVDPGESYAGYVVLDKIRIRNAPAQIQLTVNWNGEEYPFTFQVTRNGTPAPVFAALTRPSNLRDFRQSSAESVPVIEPAILTSPAPTASTASPALQTVSASASSRLNPNARVKCETCR